MPRNPNTERAKRMAANRAISKNYIYFILQGPNVWGERIPWDGKSFVKIGLTTRLRERLESLQCGNPVPLQFLGCIEGGRELEKKLHAYFSEFRSVGEWFKYTHKVAQYIHSLHLFTVKGNCEPVDVETDLKVYSYGCECTWDIEDFLEATGNSQRTTWRI